MNDSDNLLDPFDRDLLYANLKEYMMRTTLLYNLVEQGKMGKEECYNKLLASWMEYEEAAQRIFMEEREYQKIKNAQHPTLSKKKRPPTE